MPQRMRRSRGMRGARRVAVVLGALLLVALAAAGPAGADEAGDQAAGSGHDISHPQCGGKLPTSSTFGIVGVNQGRPFSANPCLAEQYAWASGRPASAAIYVNTANPAPRSEFYWPRSGSQDPALCRDAGSTTDPGCAYNYGWHAAENAMTTARKLGRTVLGHPWWLDVETMNTWNGDGPSNTAMLQGMYDYLRSHGVVKVGLYSTGFQWKKITGDYRAGTVARYQAAWGDQLRADFPLHEAPLWIAGGNGSGGAKAKCATSFTGGPTAMVQFLGDDGFDTNVTC